MRLSVHFVAVLLMVLLAAGPEVAGLYCPMDRAAGAMCAEMAEMGADCPMHGRTGLEACAPNCCSQALTSAMVAMVTPSAKLRLALPSPLETPAPLQARQDASTGFEPPSVLSTSPPRHIVLRVFRI
jgi:hypothetical protein